jgi:hypothetical protein
MQAELLAESLLDDGGERVEASDEIAAGRGQGCASSMSPADVALDQVQAEPFFHLLQPLPAKRYCTPTRSAAALMDPVASIASSSCTRHWLSTTRPLRSIHRLACGVNPPAGVSFIAHLISQGPARSKAEVR